MTKKSRRVASRQAAVGKERKHKKQSRGHKEGEQVAPARPADVTAADAEVAVPTVTPVDAPTTASPAAAPEPATGPQVKAPLPRPIALRYPYIVAELRRIAILSGAMIVIIIILTFLLG